MNAGATLAAPPAIDLAALHEVTGGNVQVERDLLGDFRDSINEDEAGLRAAHASGDAVTLRRYAHRIQGACCVIGALELAAACADIQQRAKTAPQDTSHIDLAPLAHALDRLQVQVAQMLSATGIAA
jgi:HPt (histidine-containing phosphotransfer) domain-containing protein